MRPLLLVCWLRAEEGRILRPPDGAAFPSGAMDVIATAPGGRIELDGRPLDVLQAFPNVFHGEFSAAPGRHTLALLWETGRKEVSFFVGEDPPEGFAPFRPHPPFAKVGCEQCHSLSRRGRFRFRGGCFDCHARDSFPDAHPHPVHILEECGQCHNAHGSTAAAHLLYPRETACRLCHGL